VRACLRACVRAVGCCLLGVVTNTSRCSFCEDYQRIIRLFYAKLVSIG